MTPLINDLLSSGRYLLASQIFALSPPTSALFKHADTSLLIGDEPLKERLEFLDNGSFNTWELLGVDCLVMRTVVPFGFA